MSVLNFLAQKGIGGFYKEKTRMGYDRAQPRDIILTDIQIVGPFNSKAQATEYPHTFAPPAFSYLTSEIMKIDEETIRFRLFKPEARDGQKSSNVTDLYIQTIESPSND